MNSEKQEEHKVLNGTLVSTDIIRSINKNRAKKRGTDIQMETETEMRERERMRRGRERE